MTPPEKESSEDSVKNCVIISRRRAQIALRIPISLVRSVTETSIIFIIQIHPTKRDIPAIPVTKSVI